MRSHGLRVCLLFAAVSLPASASRAQDASFGCKVLLCAAATSPGWSSIPWCVPVMQALFTQLARRKSWPACPEGNAGNVGYDPWQACRNGWTAGDDPSLDRSKVVTSNSDPASICVDTTKPVETCSGESGCRTAYPTMARTPRPEAYFVDIATASGTQRFYFSLRGY